LKKLSSILFLSVYLLTATELSQVLKFPVLWEHFHEHQLLNSNVSLVDFLKEHYFNGGRQNPDYTRDMQLPFKTHNACQANLVAIFAPVLSNIIQAPEYPALCFTISYQRQQFHSNFRSAIWQPPKA